MAAKAEQFAIWQFHDKGGVMEDSIYKEVKSQISFQMPYDLHERMEAQRKKENYRISKSAFIVGLVREGVERLEAQNNN
jgi:hypothetical protein